MAFGSWSFTELRYQLFLELRQSEGVDAAAPSGRTPQKLGDISYSTKSYAMSLGRHLARALAFVTFQRSAVSLPPLRDTLNCNG